MKLAFLAPLFFIISQAKAVTNISANLTGTVDVQLMLEKHYRHSLDCHRDGKGTETEPLPSTTLPLQGGLQGGVPGTYKWNSTLTSPFFRNIRDVTLQATSELKGLSEQVTVNLLDQYSYSDERISKGDCWHNDGLARPHQAQIQGTISISYAVPANVWAVKVTRWGRGLLSRTGMTPLQGALNPGFDKNVDSEEIFWVKPGSQLTQEIMIPSNISGTSDLGQAKITFAPHVADLSAESEQKNALKVFKEYQKIISASYVDPKELETASDDFIKNSAGLILYYDKFSTLPSRMSTQEMTSISKSLFTIANATIPSAKLGLPVKTAAALASYEIAMRLLTDLSTYCDTVDVYLPMKNQTVQVLGLRAAGFWLTRGLSGVKNYKFTQYEGFVEQLANLEANKVTYAEVKNNPEVAKQIQDAYNFITNSIDVGASPFGAALKDVQRTLNQFGAIGSNDSDTKALVKNLMELSQIESQFVRELFASLRSFSRNSNDVVKGQVYLQQLKVLQAAQRSLVVNMERNIRLLSIDGNSDATSAMNVMLGLLSHQVAIFEMPLQDVKYFETLRSEYFKNKNRISTIEKAKKCIAGGI